MSDAAILSCSGLTIGYRNQKTIVKEVATDLNLHLDRGEVVCLIGPNGSGKSTLIRTLTGIQPPLDGEVRLCNRRIEEYGPEERATTLSVVLTGQIQAGYLTAFDIVALGRFPYTNWAGKLTESDRAIVYSALASVGAADLSGRFIHEMSDGERQKVMIARALAQEPELMVLDEPTAFLDLPHKIETMRILRQVARKNKKAILLSTHDLNTAIRCADQLWIIDREGTLVAGTPEDLVLSGIFGSAFAIEGVCFDTRRGEFSIPVDHRGTFTLTAPEESVERIWTLYALERIGYAPAGEAEAGIHVMVTKDSLRTRWHVRHSCGERECGSIRELIEWLSTTEGDEN
ncbi:ABC transporter ATP-binding protein [Methanoregula sp.]|uniref:ABC transporter ATP-binding protein n=1 Tax=Methanoregula sp. TaxID=2052170 RepID=UPI0026341AF4|nr:ABC transporter ATP-binding protein [Methanoregula sp.]MDD5144192.1 ABC transporter ATP-binding protein [Methanoregula sp.]